MRILICGARGSTPAPGAAFARYGGSTSCVAVYRDGESRPALVLDAGTGLQTLSAEMKGDAFKGIILLTHLHWDHTHGLPFFPAGDRPDARVALMMPNQGDAEAVLARAMSPPHFAIEPSQLRGDWSFSGLEPGQHQLGGLAVLAAEIPHKGGRTYGYRVSDGRSTLTYMPDHHPVALGPGEDGFGPYHEAAMALARDADLLIHDAQYTAREFPSRASFGHSAMPYASGLARAAGARRLLLFHHDPWRTDDQLDALVGFDPAGPEISAAAEGSWLEVAAPTPRRA